MYRPLQIVLGIFVVGAIGGLFAIDSDRDFSGDWVLDASASQTQSVSGPVDAGFTAVERENAVQCSAAGPGGSVVKWSYALDRSETRYQIGGETRNSEAKWEGAALLVNTLEPLSSSNAMSFEAPRKAKGCWFIGAEVSRHRPP